MYILLGTCSGELAYFPTKLSHYLFVMIVYLTVLKKCKKFNTAIWNSIFFYPTSRLLQVSHFASANIYVQRNNAAV